MQYSLIDRSKGTPGLGGREMRIDQQEIELGKESRVREERIPRINSMDHTDSPCFFPVNFLRLPDDWKGTAYGTDWSAGPPAVRRIANADQRQGKNNPMCRVVARSCR